MSYDKNYYLSKGFEEPVAKYFVSGRKKIIEISVNDDFTLNLMFDNGENKLLDCKPIIEDGTVFEKISDINAFKKVYLDENNCPAWDIDPKKDSKIYWNNKIELDSDMCYIESKKID